MWQAASGIGKETVFALAQAGVEGVILADLNLSGAELVAQESTKKKWAANSHFRATAVQADVSDEAAVNNMVDIAVKEFGRIDYCPKQQVSGSPGNLSPSHSKIVGADLLVLTLLAIDNIKNHIRVNVVAPFYTETPMFEASLKRVPELGAAIKAITPLKRAAAPEEVADPIVFLCSPAASYTNGATLIIDSGITLTIPRTSL
ncbi:unnamed protein product [Aspergillus oryzae]|nr:unnamed protein product [Aspergillus oryzae]GMF89694.1 unnamed protein product [Aspergillus oryzae]GMG08994.1 unnamed protein product [Aspergillus oryzae]